MVYREDELLNSRSGLSSSPVLRGALLAALVQLGCQVYAHSIQTAAAAAAASSALHKKLKDQEEAGASNHDVASKQHALLSDPCCRRNCVSYSCHCAAHVQPGFSACKDSCCV